MSEDYKKGYRDGFKDGVEEGKKLASVTSQPPWNPNNIFVGKPGCPVCGMNWDRPMGYVCMNDCCPSRITSMGVVTGSSRIDVLPHGSNAASGGPLNEWNQSEK